MFWLIMLMNWEKSLIKEQNKGTTKLTVRKVGETKEHMRNDITQLTESLCRVFIVQIIKADKFFKVDGQFWRKKVRSLSE